MCALPEKVLRRLVQQQQTHEPIAGANSSSLIFDGVMVTCIMLLCHDVLSR